MNLTRSERLALVERDADGELSLSIQSELLGLSRASLYYEPRPAGAREVSVKRRLDELYTEHPFLGSRKLEILLEKEGLIIGRHTIRRYRREMGLEALYPKPSLSKAAQGQDHKVFPYLLRGLAIEHPNHVWGVDITYIRLTAGWMYLIAFAALLRIAFLDWHSRLLHSPKTATVVRGGLGTQVKTSFHRVGHFGSRR